MNLNDLLKAIVDNEQLLRYYAKKNCRHCVGKGYYSTMYPGEPSRTRTLCKCVIKKAKKEHENKS
jgi:hypothetical protein